MKNNLEKIKLQAKYEGLIFGAAIGDALGMPTEYISKEELDQFYRGRITNFEKPHQNHPCSHLNAGQYTDDTQQLILLAESLIEKRGFDVFDFGKKIGKWAHRCQTVSDYNRFAGGTSLTAGMKLYWGEDPLTTGVSRSTCGSAMRTGPLGLFYHNDLPKLKDAAKLASQVTHNHPAAIDSTIFISHLVAYLVDNVTLEDALQRSKEILSSDSELIERIDYVIAHKDENSPQVAAKIGTSESAYETVPMALHCFLHSPHHYEKTVVEAANLAPGDTDSIACIAGALSGTYNGVEAIPKKWRQEIEDSLLLQKLSKDLFEASV